MVEVNISSEVNASSGGVYVIRFSDGHFYIGATRNMKTRIKTHLNSIRSDFTSPATCKSLRKMKGFIGFIYIQLLEGIEAGPQNYGMNHFIAERERLYIEQHKGSNLFLNYIKPNPITRLQAISHLENSLKNDPEYRRRWKECIEMIVIDESVDLHMRRIVAIEAADKISDRILRLFNAESWKIGAK